MWPESIYNMLKLCVYRSYDVVHVFITRMYIHCIYIWYCVIYTFVQTALCTRMLCTVFRLYYLNQFVFSLLTIYKQVVLEDQLPVLCLDCVFSNLMPVFFMYMWMWFYVYLRTVWQLVVFIFCKTLTQSCFNR